MTSEDDPRSPEGQGADEPVSFVERLERRLGQRVDPEVNLQVDEAGSDADAARSSGEPDEREPGSSTYRLVRKLAGGAPSPFKLQVRKEIARGGMGTILRVWDDDLRRNLAMKVMHGSLSARPGSQADQERLLRFLEEAQITGQLDHPGIVPVHSLGVDENGACYFTMRLVRGRELKEVLDLARQGREGWTRTKVLAVILKVCEAMAFAHSKGVVHRDLKPANVMVGRFGETYVMDWGLARVVGRADSHDLRLKPQPQDASALSLVRTNRRDDTQSNPDSPLVTMDGDVVGTPSFMPVEQAQGRLEDVGPRSDVYSLGAILYYMLTGRAPYVAPGERVSPHTVLNRVLSGPPQPVSKFAQEQPEELVAICEKAMARSAEDRYGSMLEVADDIQAFLENRVVRAYEGGAVAEFRKWVARNQGMAVATAALITLSIASAFGFAWQKTKQINTLNLQQAKLANARDEAQRHLDTAQANERRAADNLEFALQQKDEADQNLALATEQGERARRSGYMANIIAADYSLRVHGSSEASKRLAECDPDLAGWEWRHLDLKAHQALKSITADYIVDAVALSPDGRTAYFLTRDGLLRSMDVEGDGGSETRFSGILPSIQITRRRLLALSHDGSLAAFAGEDEQVRIYDVESEKRTLTLPFQSGVVGHSRTTTAIAFSADDALLASGSEAGEIIVWSPRTGDVVQRLPGHQSSVTSLAFGFEQNWLVSGARDNTVRVWDLETGQSIHLLRGHVKPVLDVALDADGRWIASATEDGTINLWNAATGRLDRSLSGHDGRVSALSFDPDGRRLLSAGEDATLRVWNLESRRSEVVLGHAGDVVDAVFSADGTLILSGGADRTVAVWDGRGDASRTAIDTSGVEALAYSPDGTQFASASPYDSITLWDARTVLERDILRGHTSRVKSVAYAPDGRLLVSGSNDKTARIWDVASGRTLHILRGHEAWVQAVAFAPDGTWVLTGSGDGSIKRWDAATGELLQEYESSPGRNKWIYAVAAAPDGRRFATNGLERRITIWDVDGRVVRELEGHVQNVSCLAFDATGDHLLSGSFDGTVRLWDLATGACTFVGQAHDRQVSSVAFHPAGRRFASGSRDETVRIWDRDGAGSLLDLRHRLPVAAVAFSPDGSRLLSCSSTPEGAEGEIVLWESGDAAGRRAARLAAERVRAEVAPRVDELFDRDFRLDAVQRAILTDPAFTDVQRESAQRLARVRGDDPRLLDRTTRGELDAGRPRETYERALRRAEAACAIDDESPLLQCTLGMAQYRTARYPASVATLELAGRLGDQTAQVLAPAIELQRLLYLAMAHASLDHPDESRRYLDSAVQALARTEDLASDAPLQALLSEARQTTSAVEDTPR